MLDMDNILKLTVEEIIVINGLEEVAREAKEDSEIIHKAYNNTFGIGVEKVEVWSDGNNYEYLTHEGIWQARYIHQSYDVKVEANFIFDYYKSEWLIANGYVEEYDGNYLTDHGNKKQICMYFRAFVQRVKEKAQEQ